MRAGVTDALLQRQQTRPRSLFQHLMLWNCVGARERERQTLDVVSVSLMAYASDELEQKHRHWTASVGHTGTSVDWRQTRLSLLFMTVGFRMSWTCGVARSDRRYCTASVAPENHPVKLITAIS
jgi:hypothetical protein